MIRRAALAVSAVALLGACTPITSYQGFQAVEASPKDVKIGVDTKSTVLERLGSPSAVAAFDANQWFYITQVSDSVAFRDPSVRKRDVVLIAFSKDDEKVSKVDAYSLKDGRVVAMNRRTTPTRGRELSFIEQLLGTIGQGGNVLPQQDINPGTQRPR
jgi:outer membrane protein assembly factor BamE (lipoprotein component of BamABCDE complex)